MAKINAVSMDKDETILLLVKNKIVNVVYYKEMVVVGRWGTNKKNLLAWAKKSL